MIISSNGCLTIVKDGLLVIVMAIEKNDVLHHQLNGLPGLKGLLYLISMTKDNTTLKQNIAEKI